MTNLQVFDFDDNSIRVVEIEGQAWFHGSDAAKSLGYSNPSKVIGDRVAGKYRKLLDLGTRGSSPLFISMPGLLQLVIGSKLPNAVRFQEWVFEEVLPTILRTGNYSVHGDDSKLLIEREKTERERIKAQAKLDELRLRHELKLAELEHKQQAKCKTGERIDLDLSQPNKSVIKLNSRSRIHLSSEQKEQLKAWLQECCEVEKNNKINVGKDLSQEGTAYSSYLKWCDRHQVKPLYLSKFSPSVVLAAREIGWEVTRGRTRESRVLDGIRLAN